MSQEVVRFFLLVYGLALLTGLESKSNLRIVHQWAQLEFAFPSEEAKQTAIDKGDYIPKNPFPLDVDVHYKKGNESRIFITVPRYLSGVPITLGTIDKQGKIHAYPDYSWNEKPGENCNGITSVFRVASDDHDRLWMMDTGRAGTKRCPPQLLAFDMNTDQLVYRHVLSNSSYTTRSLFITPVVDIRPDKNETFVYAADVSDHGILVVDVNRNRSWRVTHRTFWPFPSRGVLKIDGIRTTLMDGVFGLALSPYKPGKDRKLYFHSFAATTENVVMTSLLRNESKIDNPALGIDDVYTYPKERQTQSAAEAMDRHGNLYYGQMEPPSIWSWNTNTTFSRQNFRLIASDKETLQFASGVKVLTNTEGEQELWVTTCSFQRVVTGQLTSDRINFRVHTCKISALQRGLRC